MKYLYNPVTGALDDVETPKLGEKYFASAETDEIIKQINDQFGPGTMFPASEAPQPENPYKDFEDRNPAANGGMMRKNFKLGSPQSMAISYGVKKALLPALEAMGVTLSAARLAEIATEDPTVFNKIAAYVSAIPGKLEDADENIKNELKEYISESVRATGLGLDIGPDGEKIEKEAEQIRESNKPVGFPGDYIDPGFKDQGLTIPETEKQLPNTGGKILEDKLTTGGSQIPETTLEDLISYNKKADINNLTNKKGKKTLIDILDQQKETIPNFDKLDKKSQEKKIKSLEKKITSLPQNQAYTGPALSKDYVEKVLQHYVETHHNGNITLAATELGFDKQKKRNINARLSKIGFEGKGGSAEATLNIADGKLKYVDAIKQIKDNPAIYISNIKKLIKEKDLSNKDYVSAIDLANIFNIDGLTVLERTQLLKRLNKLDVKRKKGTQGALGVKYHLGDALNKLTNYAKNKQAAPGEAVDPTKTRRSREFDIPLNNAVSATKKILRDRATNSDIVLPGESLGKDKGHAASLDVMAKFPEYFTKNSNTTNFQSFINQDKTINSDFLMSKGYHKIESAIFQRLKDKKINKDEANNELKENWDNIQRLIKIRMKTMPFLRDQGNVVPLLQLDKNSVVQADMSTVDSYFIYGNIDKINPKAKTFSSLSKKQQSQYLSNVKEQYIESAVKFLTNLKDDKTGERIYSKEEIDNYEEMLSVPLSVEEIKDVRRKYKFAAGGMIPDQEIMNYANGGRINYENGSPRGPNEPEGDSFLNELEFKFNNIDDVTLDDTPTTFDDSKSKIAQVADLANPKNIPYYADMAAQAALRVGEFGARVLPATGNLISDILQKPMFKVKSSYLREDAGKILDYGEVPENNNVRFVGGPIFKNFLKNITPTSTEKLVGLDTIINEEKKKMIERGSSSLPVKVAETASLGAELVAPIFPGLKIIKAYAKAKGIKPTKEVAKTIEQEIDAMAKSEGMNRREFLQVSGAVGTVGLAKLLGISSELPKVAKVAEKVASSGAVAPPHFLNLVAKIKNLGDDITQTGALIERQTVTKYKDFELTEDLATGQVTIERVKILDDTDYRGAPLAEESYMSFTPGEMIPGKDGKGVKTLDDYQEGAAYLHTTGPDKGGIIDDTLDLPEDIIQEGTVFEDTLSEFAK